MLTAYFVTLAVMTVITLIVYGVDKLMAVENRGRIPEIVLIVLTAFGGVLGTLLGMAFFNHKSNMSKKWYFLCTIVVPVLMQIAILLVGLDVLHI